MLGCCTLEQLKYFCKHTRNHRTGAKDRVLYLTYLGLCKQLYPAREQVKQGKRFMCLLLDLVNLGALQFILQDSTLMFASHRNQFELVKLIQGY